MGSGLAGEAAKACQSISVKSTVSNRCEACNHHSFPRWRVGARDKYLLSIAIPIRIPFKGSC